MSADIIPGTRGVNPLQPQPEGHVPPFYKVYMESVRARENTHALSDRKQTPDKPNPYPLTDSVPEVLPRTGLGNQTIVSPKEPTWRERIKEVFNK